MHPQSQPLTIGRTLLNDSDDLVILGVTFDSKLTFMIDHFLRDASGVLFCPFWSTALLLIYTLNYWTVQSVVPGSLHWSKLLCPYYNLLLFFHFSFCL